MNDDYTRRLDRIERLLERLVAALLEPQPLVVYGVPIDQGTSYGPNIVRASASLDHGTSDGSMTTTTAPVSVTPTKGTP